MNLKEILKALKLSEQNISMILGAFVVVVIGILVFNYFRGVGTEQTQPANVQVQDGEVKTVIEEGKVVPEGLPTTHQVAQNENLWEIAEKYFGSGYNWVDIAQANELGNADQLLVGQELTIPKVEIIKPVGAVVAGVENAQAISGESYTVVQGDSLWDIAVRAYGDGYQWVNIAQANGLVNPNLIHPGNALTLPR